jgi:hypothetical protein
MDNKTYSSHKCIPAVWVAFESGEKELYHIQEVWSQREHFIECSDAPYLLKTFTGKRW